MQPANKAAAQTAVALGAASIVASVLAGRPDIGVGLSLLTLATMTVATIWANSPAAPRDRRAERPWYEQPQREEKCRCGRCERCDPLAQSWGR